MGIETMMVASAIGSGLQFVGQMQTAKGMRAAGRAALQTAEYNKSIRDRNARVADQNAALRERVGGSEVVRFRKKFSKLQARGETAYRKSGVIASSGTPLQVLMDNANEAEEEVQTIRLTATTDAGRMREQGVNQRLAGQLTLLEGKQQRLAYNIKARSAQMDAFTSLGKGAYQLSQII
nr:putative internal virion protein [uncultured Mediterranean phage uvMED]